MPTLTMVDPVVNDGDDILAASWVAEFRNIIDHLLETLDLGSAASTSLHPTGAAGTGIYFPSTSILAVALAGSEVARWSSGALLSGHSVATGASPGDIVLTNNRRLAFLTSALTTSANFGIQGDSTNSLDFLVAATGNSFNYLWGGVNLISLSQDGSGGPFIAFRAELTVTPTVTANQGVLYIKDIGGVTSLVFQNDSGTTTIAP